LAGGPIGKVREGDQIEIMIDRINLSGSIALVGDSERSFSPEEVAAFINSRILRADLRPHPDLPSDTRLWAALVQASGGVWKGCVYDVDAIVAKLENGG
jgi:dihydroxyacid dehydratase/phosphogluconate dehydratase